MNCSCYISKHLYGRVQDTQSNSISVPLNQEEKKFLDFFNIEYIKDNNSKYNYIVNSEKIRNLFSNR
mgnify:FL=1